jgi:hypothetical protein
VIACRHQWFSLHAVRYTITITGTAGASTVSLTATGGATIEGMIEDVNGVHYVGPGGTWCPAQ